MRKLCKTDYVIVDKMNYHYADWVYKRHRLEYAMNAEFFKQKKMELAEILTREEISHEFIF